jgi:uncharacterized membrane protein YhaH (DUF805 family)
MLIATLMAIFRFLYLMVYQLEATKFLGKFDLWMSFMGSVAVFMGILNLTRLHSNNVRKRRQHWVFSLWCIIVMYAYTLLGIFLNGPFKAGNTHKTYRWIHDALLVPIDSAIFSLLAFFIASAAYRAFRIRTREATALLIVAVIIMLANVPIGEMIWSQFPTLGQWVLKWPNAAAQRGIQVGIFLGVFAGVLRMFLGLERKYLGA